VDKVKNRKEKGISNAYAFEIPFFYIELYFPSGQSAVLSFVGIGHPFLSSH
jgi:hypothetical protein